MKKILFLFLIGNYYFFSQTITSGWRGNLTAVYPAFYWNDNKQLYDKSYGGSYGFDGFMTSFLGARFQFDHLFYSFKNTGFQEAAKTSMSAVNFGFLIKPFPSYFVSPYAILETGGVYYYIQNSIVPSQSNNNLTYKAAGGLGLEFYRTEKMIFRFEALYNQVFTDKIDGNNFGTKLKYDSYVALGLGISFLGRHTRDSVIQIAEVKQDLKIEPKLFEKVDLPEIKEKEHELLATSPGRIKSIKPFVRRDFIKFDSALVMGDIFFESGKAALKPEAVQILQATYYWMKLNPEVEIEIAGHTDNVGSKQFNLKLSKRRAEAIKDYLTFMGIDPRRIKTVGYGFSKPVASNKTPEGRAKNRRVEFKRIK